MCTACRKTAASCVYSTNGEHGKHLHKRSVFTATSWQNPGSDAQGIQWHLNLVGSTPGEAVPEVAVQALDVASKPLYVAEVDDQGRFRMPSAILDNAHHIVIGPTAMNPALPGVDTILRYPPAQFGRLLRIGALSVPRCIWRTWFLFVRCATGRVELCGDVASKCSVDVFRRQCASQSHTWDGQRTSDRIPVNEINEVEMYRISARTVRSAPQQVAQGSINPDGRFAICWLEYPSMNDGNSRDEYAYVVVQLCGGKEITLYNGIEAGAWFGPFDDAILRASDRSHTHARAN